MNPTLTRSAHVNASCLVFVHHFYHGRINITVMNEILINFDEPCRGVVAVQVSIHLPTARPKAVHPDPLDAVFMEASRRLAVVEDSGCDEHLLALLEYIFTFPS